MKNVLSVTNLNGAVLDKFLVNDPDDRLAGDTLAYVMREWNREFARKGGIDEYCLVAPNGSRFDGEFTDNGSIKYLSDLKDWFFSNC